MKATEIQDWQFRRLELGDYGWWHGGFEWTPGFWVRLCFTTELTKDDRLPECARTIFNTLRDREKEYLALAGRDLLDTFNEMWSDDDSDSRPDEWPFDVQSFINFIELWGVTIDMNEENELTYLTGGMGFLRVFISHDLSFKEAYFD